MAKKKAEQKEKKTYELETINIKGKPYVTVNQRIRFFREAYPGHLLVTEIVERTADEVLMRTSILSPDKTVLATGYAHQIRESSFINQTSYIENCETSAVGRALGFLGIGVDKSVATAEEVTMAVALQDRMTNGEKAMASKTKKAGEYVVGTGKYKGKKIKDLDDKATREILDYVAARPHGEITGPVKETYENIQAWRH